MADNVVIVESPSKAKTINKYLGGNFTVIASYGHVSELPSKDGSVDVDHDFAMHYITAKGASKRLDEMASAIKKAKILYLATDPDREGEAISWHVLQEMEKRKALKNVQIHRVEFNEITKSAVQRAIANPRDLHQTLIEAQQARRALDYLVGFNLSPVLWRKVRPGLSAGRVQSVALRLICEREKEINAFESQEYWTIAGSFGTSKAAVINARLTVLEGTKQEKFSITSEAQATTAVNTLGAGSYTVSAVTKKQTQRRPAPPFITSTLQQEASRKLGYGAKRTMTLAQRLYEGIEVNGETVGLITYMRTDSVHLAGEALDSVRDTIGRQFGADYVPEKPNFFKTKAKNAQEAHEAIRPTTPSLTPASLKGSLDADMWKLYDLIWKRTIACQMTAALIDQTALDITSGNNQFRATGSVITFPGFLKVYREGMDDSATDELDEAVLPDVQEGDALNVKDIKPEQHFTEPPPRFSEATLVKALEELGIGRPSTYASIISVLVDRGYVKLDKRRFQPEDVGMVVSKFLTEHFSQYVDYGFTANLEDDLDAISRGEKNWLPVLREFWDPFHALVEDKKVSVKKSDVTSEATGEKCPACGTGELLIRLGKYGRFKGCSNYPECRHIEPLVKPAEGEEAAARPEPEGTGVQCPKCHEGEIVKKLSRRGKVFYSCNRYPKCQYAIWDRPEEKPCPKCQWPITTIKETKRYGTIKKCPECDWQDPPAPAGKASGPKKTAAKKTTSTKKAAKPKAKKAASSKKTS